MSPLTNDLVLTPGGSLALVSVSPTNGTAAISGTNILFTPATNFLGTASIGYAVTDGVGGTNQSLITVNVTIAGATVAVLTFTNSTTWICPAGVTSVQVDCWGGGGGGGGSGVTASGTAGAGGGGGGAFAAATVTVSATNSPYAITVGGGGAGGAKANTTTAGTGGTGAGGELVLAYAVPLTTGTNLAFQVTGRQLTLQWPASYIGWLLQSNSLNLLNTNDWFTVPGFAATNQAVINLDATQRAVFFRLARP